MRIGSTLSPISMSGMNGVKRSYDKRVFRRKRTPTQFTAMVISKRGGRAERAADKNMPRRSENSPQFTAKRDAQINRIRIEPFLGG
jgi:hypothetical protein